MRRLGIALALALALVAPAAASAAFPGANGRIAFERPGAGIFDVNPDGSGLRQLTSGPCDSHPAYSPDGRTIVFDSCGALFAVNADGSGRRALPTRLPNPVGPVFAPDGLHIALQAGSFTTGVYTQALDGSAVHAVAPHAYGPAWSVAGALAFARPLRDAEWCNSTSLQDLFSAAAAGGSRAVQLTRTYASYDPDYSPDGRSLAFTRDDTAGSRDIRRVKGIPDCRRVARAAGGYGEEVFVATASGHGLHRLTTRGGRAPAWSPDGSQIAFERRPYVYVTAARGGAARKLALGRDPAWQPLPPPPSPPASPLPLPKR